MLEYDGTDFAGFQVQRGRPTVQNEIEGAIGRIVGEPVRVVGAGRTDAGVHALGQVVSFTTESRLGLETWGRALNAHLPATIAVREVVEKEPGFHARFSATSREYRYTILNRPARAAIGRQYHWHRPGALDVARMDRVARGIVGRHDFAAFAGATGDRLGRPNTVRTVMRVDCRREDQEVVFEVTADAFLPHMVRNLVGTLVLAGRDQLDEAGMLAILASRDRARAGPTAPPHGLCLVRVNYGDSKG